MFSQELCTKQAATTKKGGGGVRKLFAKERKLVPRENDFRRGIITLIRSIMGCFLEQKKRRTKKEGSLRDLIVADFGTLKSVLPAAGEVVPLESEKIIFSGGSLNWAMKVL